MSDAHLIQELHDLGIDERNVRVLSLLPLIETAWATGTMERANPEVVVQIARIHYQLDADASNQLAGWLANAPPGALLARARGTLLALAEVGGTARDGPLPPEPEAVEVAARVARAAGHLFGLGHLADQERKTLDLLRSALGLPPRAAWRELEDIGDAPTDLSAFTPPGAAPRGAPTGPATAATPSAAAEHGPGRLTRPDGTLLAVIPAGGELTIGRGGQNRLQLRDDGEVSRFHARIFQKGQAWYVEDRGSMNGTRVNGEFVQVRRLVGNEEIGIGHGVFRFHVEA